MRTLKQIRKVVIAVAGFTVLLLGLIAILLPGTVFIISLGLTILGTEFVWAKKWLEKAKATIYLTTNGFKKKNPVSLSSLPQESCHHVEELSQ